MMRGMVVEEKRGECGTNDTVLGLGMIWRRLWNGRTTRVYLVT